MAEGSKAIGPLSFNLTDDQIRALKAIAGDRSVRMVTSVVGQTAVVDFVACNAPFSFVVDRYGKYDKLQG